jgi:outer membrane biosynthesis protein TonB
LVLIFAVVLAVVGGVDYADNGYVDGSVLGYVGRAGPEGLPAAEGPGGAEEPGTRPTVNFRVISVSGGGRTPRSVAAGLKAHSRKIADAFAGAADGNVELKISVARNGAVVKTKLRASSYADPALEGKVVNAVRSCKLEPAAGTTIAVVRLEYGE